MDLNGWYIVVGVYAMRARGLLAWLLAWLWEEEEEEEGMWCRV